MANLGRATSSHGEDATARPSSSMPHEATLAATAAAAVAGALRHPDAQAMNRVARDIRDAADAGLCIIASSDERGLRSVGVAGSNDARFVPGAPIQLRAQGRATRVVLERGRSTEPFAEMLLLLGYRTAIAVGAFEGDFLRGIVCLAFHEARSPSSQELALLEASLAPLALILRPGDSGETGHLELLGQSQKMEALGSMAGMIAHDFNNLLTTILGYTSIVKNAGRLHQDDRECLDEVEEAAHRAADLTGRLLAFARGGLTQTGALDLRAVIADTLRLVEPALNKRVRVTVELPDEAVAVDGDEGQLQQAIMNILLNARDAMPDGGDVSIRLTQGDDWASLHIRDNGPGMDAHTVERIFDPFFTTKPKGSGTGLGMSITYGIVKGHGGAISLDTAPGQGTAFHLSFPALRRLPEAHDPEAMAAVEQDLVLVVDDDDMVRRTTMATVAHLGYNVVDAPSGRVAIELVRARPERFGVVLLDLVMPELTGAQTFKELRKLRPNLPVIICTGYAADDHMDDTVRRDIAGLIHKPFMPERIAEALAKVGARKARPDPR